MVLLLGTYGIKWDIDNSIDTWNMVILLKAYFKQTGDTENRLWSKKNKTVAIYTYLWKKIDVKPLLASSKEDYCKSHIKSSEENLYTSTTKTQL